MTRHSASRPASRSLASILVVGGSTLELTALQTEPRNVPLLLLSAVAMLVGLWLLLGGRGTAARTWGVLSAGLIGGALGLFAMSGLMSTSSVPSVVDRLVSLAALVGVYPTAAGFLCALVWPQWWWRWGLILSWGFLVAALTSTDASVWPALLVLMALPFLGAKTGAVLRDRVPITSR